MMTKKKPEPPVVVARAAPWLHVASFAELLVHEKAILERIEQTPNGGHLFMIHPLRLLTDLGVVLSKEAEAEILRRHPELTGLSSTPYEALERSREPQGLRFHIRGLFRRSEV